MISGNWSNPITRGLGHLARCLTQGFGPQTAKQDDSRNVPPLKRVEKTFKFEIKIPIAKTAEQSYPIKVEVAQTPKTILKIMEILDEI